MRNIFKYGFVGYGDCRHLGWCSGSDIPVSGVVKDKSNNSTLPYASVIVKMKVENGASAFNHN